MQNINNIYHDQANGEIAMPKNILVVDDEKDLELLIRQKFRKQIKAGVFHFIFAYNGSEALSIIYEREDIDIVLTDINMPQMDGLTLLSEINKKNPELKVIIISAYGDMENIRSAMNKGAFDFLTKPIDFLDLELTISKTLDMVEHLKNATKQNKELIALQKELSLAQKIQNSILPEHPNELTQLEVEILYYPMQLVAGDYYDFHLLGEQKLGVMVADVSGHGVPAALIASMLKVAFSIVKEDAENPDILLARMNETLSVFKWEDNFVTASYVFIDKEAGKLYHSSAGHPPLLIYKKQEGKLYEINVQTTVIGLFPQIKCNHYEMDIQSGDRIIIYTDGITEAVNSHGEMFAEERLNHLIEKHSKDDVSTFCNIVLDTIAQWVGTNYNFEDDLTMVVIDIP